MDLTLVILSIFGKFSTFFKINLHRNYKCLGTASTRTVQYQLGSTMQIYSATLCTHKESRGMPENTNCARCKQAGSF